MKSWNIVLAALFVFLAATLLTAAVDVATDARQAQILVAPDFGEVADQAFDHWRFSVFRLFSVFGL